MLRKIWVVAILMIAVALFGGVASAHDYVGADKCKICHKGDAKGNVWEIWEKTAHAKAYQALVDKGDGSEKKAECLTCHVTGLGKATGFDPKAEAPNMALANVGCEACHGPGADYKAMSVMKDKAKAIEAGLIIPDEKTCIACHNEKSPTFKGFKFDEYWAKIKHPVMKAEKTE